MKGAAFVPRVILSAGCIVAAFGITAGARQQPFKSGARTVAVYATVTDAGGRLVPDLTRDDFEIYDNGKLQPVSVFASDIQPITIVVMLDRSGSMRANNRLVEAAGEAFVERLLPADKARIGSFAAPDPGRSARLHQRQGGDDPHPPDRAAAGRPDAAVERGERRDDGAPPPGRPPRRAGLHRRRGSADELQHPQRQPARRDVTGAGRGRDGLCHRPREPRALRRPPGADGRRLRRATAGSTVGRARAVVAWCRRSRTKGSRKSRWRPAAATSS